MIGKSKKSELLAIPAPPWLEYKCVLYHFIILRCSCLFLPSISSDIYMTSHHDKKHGRPYLEVCTRNALVISKGTVLKRGRFAFANGFVSSIGGYIQVINKCSVYLSFLECTFSFYHEAMPSTTARCSKEHQNVVKVIITCNDMN